VAAANDSSSSSLSSSGGVGVMDILGGEWEPDEPSPFGADGKFSLERLDDLHEYGDAASMFPSGEEGRVDSSQEIYKYDYKAERRRRQNRRLLRWEEASGGSDRMDEILVLSPVGLCVALNDAHWSALYREPMTCDFASYSSNRCWFLWCRPSHTLGEACATLRGENELWLGVALSSPAVEVGGIYKYKYMHQVLCQTNE
jgi:hypothetical protein